MNSLFIKMMSVVLTMNLNDWLQLILLVTITGHKVLICHHSMYHSNITTADHCTLLCINQLQPAELHIHTRFTVCSPTLGRATS
jgi:hypothetical protein